MGGIATGNQDALKLSTLAQGCPPIRILFLRDNPEHLPLSRRQHPTIGTPATRQTVLLGFLQIPQTAGMAQQPLSSSAQPTDIYGGGTTLSTFPH
jgi:hypothetical protein